MICLISLDYFLLQTGAKVIELQRFSLQHVFDKFAQHTWARKKFLNFLILYIPNKFHLHRQIARHIIIYLSNVGLYWSPRQDLYNLNQLPVLN